MITKPCRISGKKFKITAEDLEFYAKMGIISEEDLAKLKSREISDCAGLPTLCPEERQRRRLAWRNERKLYKRKCDGTKKEIISMYAPEYGFVVYDNDYWWSDNWNAKEISRDFDFSRPFFEQFDELNRKVPKMARIQQGENVNSTYCNCASWNKNCYLLFSSNKNEDCLYGKLNLDSKDCIDCSVVARCELCYESVNMGNCYNCLYSFTLENCTDCVFCKQCIGCSNCFGCVNLRNKQYHFLNKKYTKEEYKKKIKEIQLSKYSSYKGLRKNFKEFIKKFPQKSMEGIQNENCTGDIVYFSKNAQECYDVEYLEDCKFCNDTTKLKSSYDISFYGAIGTNELLCEGEGVGHGVFEIKFSKLIWGGSSNIEYCWECFKCLHCFGCSGLRHAQYCILNKQYTKKEYFKTREKIIEHMKKTGEWGEFFPIELSPFCYNETVAQEYFPLNPPKSELKDQKLYQHPALNFKYKWKDKISRDFKPATIQNIPDDISEVEDLICREILACENKECKKNYQIQKPELRFYRKMNLPIPRKCPDCRHAERMKLRNPRKLFSRNCTDCGKDIQTTFAPDRPEKVLCEDCYLKVVD